MILKEMLRDEREEGRVEQAAESLIKLLSKYDDIPLELQKIIREEKNFNTLDSWFALALDSDSLDEFLKQM